MFPLDFLGVTLAWTMHLRVEMPGVRPPMIELVARFANRSNLLK